MAEIGFAESVVIAAPLERVYEYRLDFTNLPEYNPNAANIRRLDDGIEPGVGADYVFDLTMGGATMETPLRVVEATPHSRIVFVTGPGFMAKEDCSFVATDEGTLVEFAYTLTFPGEIDEASMRAMEASGREAARAELDNIKKVLE